MTFEAALCVTLLQPALICCLLGILTGRLFPVAAGWIVLLPVLGMFLWRVRRLFVLLSAMLLFCCGWFSVPKESVPDSRLLELQSCLRVFEGIIDTVPVHFEGRTRWIIELSGVSACVSSRIPPAPTPARGRMFVTVSQFDSSYLRGDTIRFIGKGRRIHFHRNPGMPEGSRWKDAAVRGFLPDTSAVVRIRPSGRVFEALLNRLRCRIAGALETTLPERHARLAIALTLGQASVLSSEDRELFRDTGTAHLLAVSGLHLGMILFLVFGGLRFLLRRMYGVAARTDVTRIAALLTLPVLLLFTLITGANPPVLRAFTMSGFVLLALILHRGNHGLQSLLIAATAMLLLDPFRIDLPGFQLSFGTVLCLILCHRYMAVGEQTIPPDGESVHPVRYWMGRMGKYICGLFVISLLACVVTTPLLLWHFQRFSPAAPLLNMVAVPITSLLVMPSLLIMTVLILMWPAAAVRFSPVCEEILSVLYGFIQRAGAMVDGVTLTDGYQIASVCLACLGVMLLITRRLRMAAAIIIVSVLLWTLPSPPSTFVSGELTIDALDTGQGDATLITFPDGAHWLVDGGGTARKEIGREHLVPILRGLGVRRLETLVLTHPDADHVDGLPDVLEAVEVGEIWDNGQNRGGDVAQTYSRLLQLAAQKNVPVRTPDEICGIHQRHGVRIEVIHPCDANDDVLSEMSSNDQSIVLMITMNPHRVLLPGDLSRDGEEYLLEKRVALEADVLKLGHHGSRSSTTEAFLQAVNPQVAIASCGPDNRFGFPSPEVLERLHLRDITVLRTDINGAVRVRLGPSGRIVEPQQ